MRRLGLVVIVVAGLMALFSATELLAFPLSIAATLGEPGSLGRRYVVLTAIPAFGALLFGLVLMWKRRELAEWWFEDTDTDIAIGPREILRAGLLITGIAVVIQAAPSLVGYLLDWSTVGNRFPALIATATKGVLGALLVAFARPVSERLWRGRRAKPSPAEAHQPPHRCPACGTPFDPADYRAGVPPHCAECGGPLDFDGA